MQMLPNGSGSSKGKPPVLKAWGAGGSGGGGGESKARYRDGALVSTRGEKFVIEKVGQWDQLGKGCATACVRNCVAFWWLPANTGQLHPSVLTRCTCRVLSGTAAHAAR